MRGQGAVEYIIILGVIVLVSLVVVASIGGFNIFDFAVEGEISTSEISNQLRDVGVQYAVASDGGVQLNVKSNKNKEVTCTNVTIYGPEGQECNLEFDEVKDEWVFESKACSFLNGSVGSVYRLNVTVSYVDDSGLTHKKKGELVGKYEEALGLNESSAWYSGCDNNSPVVNLDGEVVFSLTDNLSCGCDSMYDNSEVVNGGFENDLTGWNTSLSSLFGYNPSDNITLTISEDVSYDGSKSLLISNNQTFVGNPGFGIKDHLNIRSIQIISQH
jgi:hypothetical protein